MIGCRYVVPTEPALMHCHSALSQLTTEQGGAVYLGQAWLH